MSDPAEQKGATVSLRLADAVREVKNAAADRRSIRTQVKTKFMNEGITIL